MSTQLKSSSAPLVIKNARKTLFLKNRVFCMAALILPPHLSENHNSKIITSKHDLANRGKVRTKKKAWWFTKQVVFCKATVFNKNPAFELYIAGLAKGLHLTQSFS